MSKVLAVMIAGLFAVGAYAQNPAGQSPEQGNTNTKSQQRADAKRASYGAMPRVGFNGLPGDTSHQTSSRPSAAIAARLIRRCPRCAGLKEPPSRPIFLMHANG